MHPKATKEKGEKKAGAWAPPLLRIDNGNHLHPQATKHRKKKRKKTRSLTLYQDLAMAPAHSQKQQNKKKKGGASLCQKLAMEPTCTQKQQKKRGKKKAGAWAPPLLRIDNGNHLHPQATKHSQKKKKKQGA
jgi:hypothetical protein